MQKLLARARSGSLLTNASISSSEWHTTRVRTRLVISHRLRPAINRPPHSLHSPYPPFPHTHIHYHHIPRLQAEVLVIVHLKPKPAPSLQRGVTNERHQAYGGPTATVAPT